jgi:hypothetical protein
MPSLLCGSGASAQDCWGVAPAKKSGGMAAALKMTNAVSLRVSRNFRAAF